MALVIKLLGGLSIWAAGFSALYALHGYGCALSWGSREVGPFTVLGLLLILLWSVVLFGAVLFALWVGRRAPEEDEMIRRLGAIGAWAGFVGLILTGVPVVLPAHCL